MEHAGPTGAKVGTWLPAGSLAWRELIRFYRYRSRVVGALATPLVFWLLIGAGIGSIRLPGAASEVSYLEYFFPGIVLQVLLFSSIFTMMSVIEDRQQGFLLSALVAPAPRRAIVLGKVLGGSLVALLQATAFLLLAPVMGFSAGGTRIVQLVGILFVIALALTALGFIFAWYLDSAQGFHTVTNLLLIPLWLLSGALFPTSGASPWIQWVMKFNPLSYALSAMRHGFYAEATTFTGNLPSFAFSTAVTCAFAGLSLVCAMAVARRNVAGSLG